MSAATSADGTTIDYDAYGGGPAVVFVGGAVQHRAIDPATTAAAISLAEQGHTTVVYDRRGRGPSSDTPPWSLEREVEDLGALIAAVGEPAVLYTSSSGATIGLAAAQAGIGVVGAVVYEPPFFPGTEKAGQIDAIRAYVDRGDFAGAMRYQLENAVGLPTHVVDGIAQSPMWGAMCSVAPTLLYDFSALLDINSDPDWSARWSAITVPVSVCSGGDTSDGLTAAADRVAAALPISWRRIAPGQGHSPSPEAIADTVTDFLAASGDETAH